MTDPKSRTIDRHEPILPDSIQGELSVSYERLMTKLKNQFILPNCNVGQIKRWIKMQPSPSTIPPKVITDDLLSRALDATLRCVGELEDHHLEFLKSKGVDRSDISRFNICSTKELCKHLSEEDVTNLSLEISHKFDDIVEYNVIDGVSIPCFYGDKFHGFCTRILDQDKIKYSISIPHRFCFGINPNASDVYVVEGVFDAIQMIKKGHNAMALGDSQPNYWKMFIADKFDFVHILMDNDYSGMLGASKCHVILEEMLGRQPNDMEILISNDNKYSSFSKITLKDLASRLTILGRTL